MQRKVNELKVGMTVVVVFVLFIAVLAFIGKWDTFFADTRELHVRFRHQDGIGGLRVNDPVRLGGLTIGRVESIYVQSDDGSVYIHVTAEVPEDIPLTENCRISIQSNLLGEGGSMDILDTGKGETLAEEQVVEGGTPSGMALLWKELDDSNEEGLLYNIKHELDKDSPDALLAKVHSSISDINDITTSLRQQTDSAYKEGLIAKFNETATLVTELVRSVKGEFDRGDKEATLARVYLALDTLNESLATAKSIISDAQPRFKTTLAHVETTAKRLDEDISTSVADELNRENVGSLLAKLHASMESAKSGMANLRDMTDTGKELIVINRDNLQATLDNFAQTSSHLKATAKEIRRNPWRLLYKPDKSEREFANLMQAARNLSEAANFMDQSNSKLARLLKLRPDGAPADDPQLHQIHESVKKAFCEFEEAQKKLWDLLKVTPEK